MSIKRINSITDDVKDCPFCGMDLVSVGKISSTSFAISFVAMCILIFIILWDCEINLSLLLITFAVVFLSYYFGTRCDKISEWYFDQLYATTEEKIDFIEEIINKQS